jgi:P pilus assembly chaperone PapD
MFRILKKFIYIFSFVILCGISLGNFQNAYAAKANATSLVFENEDKSKILTLSNDSNESQTYVISWKDAAPGESSAIKEVVRFAPRRITIPSGASQDIRLLLRGREKLEVGEHKAYLLIVPETKHEAFNAEYGPFLSSESQTIIVDIIIKK